jgi:hypothetical protein
LRTGNDAKRKAKAAMKSTAIPASSGLDRVSFVAGGVALSTEESGE